MFKLSATFLVVALLGFLATPTAAQVFNCTNALVDCSARGICANSDLCVCNDGYITYRNTPNVQCNYQQAKVLGPFLAQFIIGWFSGAGCFMIHEIGFGVSQILVFWVPLLVNTFFKKRIDEDKEYYLTWFYVLAITALWVTSLVMIGSFQFTDKNGAPMIAWV